MHVDTLALLLGRGGLRIAGWNQRCRGSGQADACSPIRQPCWRLLVWRQTRSGRRRQTPVVSALVALSRAAIRTPPLGGSSSAGVASVTIVFAEPSACCAATGTAALPRVTMLRLGHKCPATAPARPGAWLVARWVVRLLGGCFGITMLGCGRVRPGCWDRALSFGSAYARRVSLCCGCCWERRCRSLTGSSCATSRSKPESGVGSHPGAHR